MTILSPPSEIIFVVEEAAEGTLLWNIAVLPDDERREGMLADVAERFAGEQREDFERTARMMIERHRTMFPEWHSR